MGEFLFTSLREAGKAIERDMRARDRRVRRAANKAAPQAARAIVKNVPRAFDELADSVHVEDHGPGKADAVADAPHAAAVENGTRPHRPPLDPLIRWVQLRGLQGTTAKGMVRRENWQSNARKGGFAVERARAARSIALQIRKRLGKAGTAEWHAKAAMGSLAARELGADPTTVAIAKAIQAKIAKYGTKPRKYVEGAVPDAMHWLGVYVNQALPDQ